MDERNPAPIEPGAEVGAPAVDERADHVAATRVHGREPARARAANETQQERLGLVVPRVAEGDAVGAEVAAGPLEERVAGGARRVLEQSTLAPRPCRDILAIGEARDAQPRRQRHRQGLVGCGLAAKLVVEVGDPDDLEVASRGQLVQQTGERDRVGPARHGGDEARVGTRQVVPPDRAPDAVEDLHGTGLPPALTGHASAPGGGVPTAAARVRTVPAGGRSRPPAMVISQCVPRVPEDGFEPSTPRL